MIRDTTRRITLFGCGGWGSRIARTLAAMGLADRLVLVDAVESRAATLAAELDCRWSCDPYGYLVVTGTQANSTTGGHVIVATDPGDRLNLVLSIMGGYGVSPVALRVEKPVAYTLDDAVRVVEATAGAGVRLTTGFTLLHHPLYEAAFDYLRATGSRVDTVMGTRIGKRARHRIDALPDIGIHTASIAAHLNADCHVRCGYSQVAEIRTTSILTDDGWIEIDELAHTVTTPDGELRVDTRQDALTLDLLAWLRDQHRGSVATSLRAHEIIDEHLARVVAA